MITTVDIKTGQVTQRPLTEAEIAALPVVTEEDLAREARELFKQERAKAVAAIVVEVDGLLFDGDEISQGRMARAIVAMEEEETALWVLANNEDVLVTRAQLKEALRLAGAAQTAVWVMP